MIFKTFSFIFCGKECLEAILPNVQTFFVSLKPDYPILLNAAVLFLLFFIMLFTLTSQKMKFSIKDFFSKCKNIRKLS